MALDENLRRCWIKIILPPLVLLPPRLFVFFQVGESFFGFIFPRWSYLPKIPPNFISLILGLVRGVLVGMACPQAGGDIYLREK